MLQIFQKYVSLLVNHLSNDRTHVELKSVDITDWSGPKSNGKCCSGSSSTGSSSTRMSSMTSSQIDAII